MSAPRQDSGQQSGTPGSGLENEGSSMTLARSALQGAMIGGGGALLLSAVAWYAARKTQASEVALLPLMAAGVLGGMMGSSVVALLRGVVLRRRKAAADAGKAVTSEDPGLLVFALSLGALTFLAGVAGALPFILRWVPLGQKESSPLWSVPLGAAIGLFASGIWTSLRQLEVGRSDGNP
jgi:hypothetical protein